MFLKDPLLFSKAASHNPQWLNVQISAHKTTCGSFEEATVSFASGPEA